MADGSRAAATPIAPSIDCRPLSPPCERFEGKPLLIEKQLIDAGDLEPCSLLSYKKAGLIGEAI